MSIQGNINQAMSIAGLIYTQSPAYKSAQEGRAIQGKQTQAIRGLKDIEKNLRREEITNRVGPPTKEEAELIESEGPKNYNAQELQNIRKRASQYQNDIYDAKSAALNPLYKGRIKSKEIKQEELSKTLSSIDEKTNRALERLKARQKEQQASKIFTKIMNGEPIDDMFGMEYNESNFPEEDLIGPDSAKISDITDENDPYYVPTLADKRKRAEEELEKIYNQYEILRNDLEWSYEDWHNGRQPTSNEAAEKASIREASNILGKLPLTVDQFLGLVNEGDDNESADDFIKRLKSVLKDKKTFSKAKNIEKKKPEEKDG